MLFCGATAPCLAQIGVTYDSLLWQPDGSTGLYSDPNHWHLSDDPQVQRTDTTPRPTDVINIHYGTIVFTSSATNASLQTFPISGETARLQLDGNTWFLTTNEDTAGIAAFIQGGGTVSIGSGTLDASAGILIMPDPVLCVAENGATIHAGQVIMSAASTLGRASLDIGSGAKLTSDDAIYVGESLNPNLNKPTPAYTSLLTIESGGKGNASTFLAVASHQNGSLTIKSGGTMTDVNGYVGAETGAMGTATIQGTWTNTDFFVVGLNGNGNLSVNSGGQLISTDGYVGFEKDSFGNVDLGSSGKWMLDGNLTIGTSGTGTVLVENGGTLEVTGQVIVLGQELGSNGTLTIDRSDSKLTGKAAMNLEIGRHGNGTLELHNGATFTLPETILGGQSDGSGTINVDGKGATDGVGSELTTTDPLTIGGASKGTMNISGGGVVEVVPSAIIGRDGKSVGKVTVSGKDSSWDIQKRADPESDDGNLIVGQSGSGTLTISNEAQVISGNTIVGQEKVPGLTANVEVSGKGSAWIPTSLTLGKNGAGILTIKDGGKVNAVSATTLGETQLSFGKLELKGNGSLFQTRFLEIGENGNGVVVVTSDPGASQLNKVETNVVVLGDQENGFGTLTIDGPSSILETHALRFGSPISSGSGMISILNGGILEATSSNEPISFSSGTAAPTTVMITGQGSALKALTRQLQIGGLSTVKLDLGLGAIVQTGPATIGKGSGPGAEVNLFGATGAPAQWTIRSDDPLSFTILTIGDGQKGTLTIGNQSVVNVIGGDVEVGGLLNQPGTLTVNGSGALLTISKGLRVGGFEISSPGNVTVIGGGKITTDGVDISGNTNGTTLTVRDAGSGIDTANEFSAKGSAAVSVLNSGTVKAASIFIGGNLGVASNGYVKTNSELFVNGVLDVTGGGSIDIGPFLFDQAASGTIRIGAFGTLRDDGLVTGNVFNFGGIVTGSGTINGKLISSGRTGPGNSPGILTVQGDFTQNSDGLTSIEIGGTSPGSGYDQVQVSGTATIDGKLDVRLVNGFTPTVGQTFRIVNANSFSGAFPSISGPSQAGISVSNDAGGVTVTIISVVAGAPVISSATTVAATQGQSFNYQIAATNNPTSFGAMNLPDGLTVDHASGLIFGIPTKAGNYIVPMAANNAAGSGQADLIIDVGPPAVTKPPQLLNISTRMRVLAGDNVLIGGFIVAGTEPKKVIIRGIGPSLGAAGLSGTLADPTLELHQPDGTVIANDNWKINTQTGQSQEADIRATTIPPTDDLESAIIATLPPGNYSAVLAGKNQSSGIGVVEVYDLAQTSNSQLANISSRGFIDTGDNVMIGGFIVGGGTGGGNANVIVRALGPSVPVAGALGDPTLELHDASGTTVTSNDNWKIRPDGSSQQAEIEATTIPPSNDLDSALVATLPPGNYTAIVRGKNNTTGVGLVEFYELQ